MKHFKKVDYVQWLKAKKKKKKKSIKRRSNILIICKQINIIN